MLRDFSEDNRKQIGVGMIAASVVSAGVGAASSRKASKAQSGAAANSIAEQRRQFELTRGDTEKYRSVGGNALYGLADMVGVGYDNPYDQQIADLEGSSGDNYLELEELKRKQAEFNDRGNYDYKESPGYQFRLDEGYKGMERSQAGRRLSGRALKESMRYGQDYASNEFGNTFGRLSSLAGFGPAGVNTSAAANPANAISDAYANQGQAQAAAAYNSGQAVNDSVQGGLSNWYAYNKMNTQPDLSAPPTLPPPY